MVSMCCNSPISAGNGIGLPEYLCSFNLLKKDMYKLASFRSVFEMVFRLCADAFVSKRPWIVNQLPV